MHLKDLEKALKKRSDIHSGEIRRAYEFAEKAHKGQKRKTGEDYVTHPVAVAMLLLEIGADEESLIAALLHDTVEDTDVTLEDVEKEFGKKIATITDSITKVSNINLFSSPDENKTATFRKMFSGGITDERAILIKLADRAHNTETLDKLRDAKALRIAEETMNIYYPLAKLFGVWKFKQIFEKHCFPIRHAEKNKYFLTYIEKFKKENLLNIQKYKKEIEDLLSKKKIIAKTSIIFKSPRELFEEEAISTAPTQTNHIEPFFIDISTETINDCYVTLGGIHGNYSWKEKEFIDFISLPKNNGYRSIHTSVFIHSGKKCEIHIQTKAMERINMCGAYYFSPEQFPKEMINLSLTALDKNYYTSQQYLSDLKTDILQKKIIIFSEEGKTVPLPKNATGIDFAYMYDCDKAHLLKAVKIDGKLCPPTLTLKNGQIVELLYGKQTHLKTYWLNHTRTSIAKHHIIKWLSHLSKKELYKRGVDSVTTEFVKAGEKRSFIINDKIKNKIIAQFPDNTYEEIISNIGKGIISPKEFIQKYLQITMNIRKENPLLSFWDGIIKEFFHTFYFFFTSNVQRRDTMVISLNIRSIDKPGMLLNILQIIAEKKLNVSKLKVFSLRPSKDALYKMDIETEDYKQTSEIIDELSEIDGVKELTRE